MITEHARAVLDLFVGFPHTLYDGQVPDAPTFPYAVLYISTPSEDATKLCGNSDVAEFDFQATSVGMTAESARIVADDVRTAVLDKRLTVSGRNSGQVRHEYGQQVRVDRSVTIPEFALHPMYAVDGYRVPSHS